jgi:GNAT superfamily N-acetyltransferase
MAQSFIVAFLHAMSHKFSVETGAIWTTTPFLTAIIYPDDLHHPWPRQFSYRHEFFASQQAPDEIAEAISEYLGSKNVEFILNIFSNRLEVYQEALPDLGYLFAWSNVLMKIDLDRIDIDQPIHPERIRKVTTPQDVDRINDIQPEHPSHGTAIADPDLHDCVVEVDGEILGKGQMVTIHPEIAYLSDMFVRTDARQKGIGTDLVRYLHLEAASSGIRHILLIPSRMARQIAFYEKFGYRDLIPMHLFIPAGD